MRLATRISMSFEVNQLQGQDEEEEDEQEEGQPDPDAVYVDEIMDEVDALAEEKVKAFPRLPELEEEEEEEEE